MSGELHKVFVYGTLQRGQGNNRWLRDGVFLCTAASVHDKFVLSTGGFPVLYDENDLIFTESSGENRGTVLGEIYEVSDFVLTQSLDRLEGHPDWYHREVHDFYDVDTKELHEAWVYMGRQVSRSPESLIKTQGGILRWS